MIEHISKKQVAAYVFLPGIRSRLSELLGDSFRIIPYLLVLILSSVRLLPQAHPYLDPQNIGRYGLLHVLAAAANNLVFKVKNIDQIILFIVILAGIVITALQLIILSVGLFINPVLAADPTAMPTNFSGFFITQNPEQDLSHMMLDLVFGVPEIFNSCVTYSGQEKAKVFCEDLDGNPLKAPDAIEGSTIFGKEWPFPIHTALHNLFLIYSLGLLMIGMIIASYFIVTILAETAQSGTPFGKRFNKVWAPVRIVMAFGLLIPIAYGLNTAQFVVLYAAKFGTGFASNGWTMFTGTLDKEFKGSVGRLETAEDLYIKNHKDEKLIATPNFPEITGLLQFMFVAKTCFWVDQIQYPSDKKSFEDGITEKKGRDQDIVPYIVRDPFTPGKPITKGMEYKDFIATLSGDNVAVIRFGVLDESENAIYKGNVSPICGELMMSLTQSANPARDPVAPGGIELIQKEYFRIIKELWYSEWRNTDSKNAARNYAIDKLPEKGFDFTPEFMTRDKQVELYKKYKESFLKVLKEAVKVEETFIQNFNQKLRVKGWAGAPIGYKQLIDRNGAVTGATFKIPAPNAYPAVLEKVRERKQAQDKNVSPGTRFEPVLSGGVAVFSKESKSQPAAEALYASFKSWEHDGALTSAHTAPTGNIVIDAINVLMGTDGLFNMKKNADVHPLAQLAALGKTLVDASIRNLAAAAGSAGSGIILNRFFAKMGSQQLIDSVSGFLITIAMVSITAGFILYYIVPFLPFIYFFFAVGGWVKGVFEAMIGVPLWALAHIRIDQEGLPGPAALGGYFLIFEVFLRPILIVFGFIASIMIFASLVRILNDIFTLVTVNVGGFDVEAEMEAAEFGDLEYFRGPVDEFFYTIVYAVVVYMIGMSCFKLIDQVPNSILRWMGQQVQTFGDQREDPAENLVQFSNTALTQGTGSLESGLSSVTKAINIAPKK